jgi:RNA polymerase-binding transcription factor DksA
MLDLNKYKNLLEEEKSALTLQLQDMAVLNTETGEWEVTPDVLVAPESDSNDMADRFEDFEESSSIVKSLQERYTDINDALSKIENGKYGICEVSGKEIEEDRLDANPAARTCKEFMNN